MTVEQVEYFFEQLTVEQLILFSLVGGLIFTALIYISTMLPQKHLSKEILKPIRKRLHTRIRKSHSTPDKRGLYQSAVSGETDMRNDCSNNL